MPIYEYRCENDHIFEVMQRMTDDPVAVCEVCGAPVQRVFHPVAVHFKGSGFYNTDYGTRKRAREKAAESSTSDSGKGSGSESSKSSDGSSKSDSSSSAPSSSKSESTSSSAKKDAA